MAAESGLDLWRMATVVIGVGLTGGAGWLLNLASNQRATEEWRKTVETRLEDSAEMRDAVIAMTSKVEYIERDIGEIKVGQQRLLDRIADCPKMSGS